MSSEPTLVDAAAAAVSVRRPPATIRYWAHRRWLTRHTTKTAGRRRVLFDLDEIHEVNDALEQGDTPPERTTA